MLSTKEWLKQTAFSSDNGLAHALKPRSRPITMSQGKDS